LEKPLTAIRELRVGPVLSIEISRLARNGPDWHTPLEFCGLVGTLIVDEDGIYDPQSVETMKQKAPTRRTVPEISTARM
jgi:hypothetical protein